MDIKSKIQTIYPQLTDSDFLVNIVIQDDGAGAYLKSWNCEGLPEPNQDQLDSITDYPFEHYQKLKSAQIESNYEAEIVKSVRYTSKGGVTQTYQADDYSVSNLQKSLSGCQAAKSTPNGFYWKSEDNTKVPFTYEDLQGLAQVIFAQGAAAFVNLQALKDQVLAAQTIAEVAAIQWGSE